MKIMSFAESWIPNRTPLGMISGFAISTIFAPIIKALGADYRTISDIEGMIIWVGALLGDYIDNGPPTLRGTLLVPALAFALGSFLEAFIPGLRSLTGTTTLASGLALTMYDEVKKLLFKADASATPDRPANLLHTIQPR